ncbi:hypothetical protein QTP88_025763 [Uroleucon formosanum]
MLCGTQEKPLPIFKKKWRASKNCDRTTLLTLRRPTAVSKFRDTVPIPNYPTLRNSLPSWRTRKLDEKIPMYHGNTPSGPIVFHRGPMGNNPLQTDTKLSFILNDPYKISHKYNPLHDPHLKYWVNLPVNQKLLQKQKLITENNDVICSLNEYNEYRRFLFRIHNDSVMHMLKVKDAENEDRRKITIANLNYRKELLKKLKMLAHEKSKNKQRTTKSKRNSIKPTFEPSNKERKQPFKKIKTYTEFGTGPGGVIDQSKYEAK